ncbi:hypothetical protein N9901_03315 [Flavobacteriaceae bacterium]|nr:hypothetical protein [Flavobacteriaceae bacterium]
MKKASFLLILVFLFSVSCYSVNKNNSDYRRWEFNNEFVTAKLMYFEAPLVYLKTRDNVVKAIPIYSFSNAYQKQLILDNSLESEQACFFPGFTLRLCRVVVISFLLFFVIGVLVYLKKDKIDVNRHAEEYFI